MIHRGDDRGHATWLGRRRCPAVPVAVSFAVGILLDRWLHPSWLTWLVMGLFLTSHWLACHIGRSERMAAVLLFGCCLCVGGARHHVFRSAARDDDVSLFASEEGKPVRLTGTLITQPFFVSRKDKAIRSAWPQFDRTLCTVDCRSILTDRNEIPVSGLARLTVTGHVLHADVGDEVEIRGWLWRPGGPANPGEFDFRDYLSRQGIRCEVSAEFPEAVRRIRAGDHWRIHRWLETLRRQTDFLFIKYLRPRQAAVASALILGNRSQMTHDLRQSFAETGMMHLLAISGLHVGILAMLLWMGCRWLRLSSLATSVVVLTVIAAYAGLTYARPPVIRAAVFVCVVGLGRPWFRRSPLENTLAISALLILAWNPADLFDVGAQLSFLAVMGIISSNVFDMTGQPVRSVVNVVSLARPPNRFRKWLEKLGTEIKRGYVVVSAVWVFTLPLVIADFHLVSPVGLVMNVFLMPVIILVLWNGYLFVVCGLLLPEVAPLLAWAFDGGLWLLLEIVDRAADVKLAHLYLPGPPTWWLVGYYLLLGAVMWFRGRRLVRRTGWIALIAWTAAGLTIGLLPAQREGLRCTVLSVGHGCSVLVEMPNGKTLLYDAGSLQDGLRAEHIVEGALWERGRSRIDALALSHADVDHFNAVPGLLDTVPVGGIYVARQFLDVSQKPVKELCHDASAADVPIKVIRQGDRLLIDDDVTVRILHPNAGDQFETDNANSLVMEIDYAGRRILLTGDLEGPGLQQLLARPKRKVDVLLAPHHGSLKANPPAFAQWARPDYVVVSGGRALHPPALQNSYGEHAHILFTREEGAVTVKIDPNGEIRVRGNDER